ncbi:MAG: hypothetical protein HRT64_14625 [Erythrobacter sp.]|nr:hypothetical protein [Erythrobacter sp.]
MNIGVGLALGVAMGAAFDNVALGLCLGLAIGAGMDYSARKKSEEADEPE